MVVKIFDQIIAWVKKLQFIYLGWRQRSLIKRNTSAKHDNETGQDLAVYWDENFARELATWGLDTAWLEIQYLLATGKGKVLDIACGCGSVMNLFPHANGLSVYGCDISNFLINKAIESGTPRERLTVCDATRTPYHDNEFDFSYSIGSLEHFTEEGILAFLKETRRITAGTSFHQIPTSRSGCNEGWIRLGQSYFNNSIDWWLQKFRLVYSDVRVMPSRWEDPISIGKWFVCTQ